MPKVEKVIIYNDTDGIRVSIVSGNKHYIVETDVINAAIDKPMSLLWMFGFIIKKLEKEWK